MATFSSHSATLTAPRSSTFVLPSVDRTPSNNSPNVPSFQSSIVLECSIDLCVCVVFSHPRHRRHLSPVHSSVCLSVCLRARLFSIVSLLSLLSSVVLPLSSPSSSLTSPSPVTLPLRRAISIRPSLFIVITSPFVSFAMLVHSHSYLPTPTAILSCYARWLSRKWSMVRVVLLMLHL